MRILLLQLGILLIWRCKCICYCAHCTIAFRWRSSDILRFFVSNIFPSPGPKQVFQFRRLRLMLDQTKNPSTSNIPFENNNVMKRVHTIPICHRSYMIQIQSLNLMKTLRSIRTVIAPSAKLHVLRRLKMHQEPKHKIRKCEVKSWPKHLKRAKPIETTLLVEIVSSIPLQRVP